MGSRANYIVTSGGRHAIYYSHWGAQSIERDFFFGMEPALSLIRSAARVSEIYELAEGGAIIDCDRKSLRLWGEDASNYDPRLRKIWLEMLRLSWEGWEVDWCHERAVGLAKYLGLPLQKFLIEPDRPAIPPTELKLTVAAPELHGIKTLITTYGDGAAVRDVFVSYTHDCFITKGSGLLNEIRSFPTSPLPTEAQWGQYLVFADLTGQKLWISPDARPGYFDPRLQSEIESAWPGWEVHLHDEGMAYHIRLSRRDPRPLQLPVSHHLKCLGGIITSGNVDPEKFLKLGLTGFPTDATVVVNPGFRQKHDFPMPLQKRMDYFLDIVSRWKGMHGDEE
jgi:hypothetical protein